VIAAGTKLGRYEIRSKIGEGGMGEVYRARDEKLNRDVAIKVLPVTLSQDPDRLLRFEQEAQAAGALNHPNILSVYDVDTHDGAPYVVSELLEGESLRDRIAETPIRQGKAIEYAVQIAHGLAAAHEKGIVHRDIKPDNLFITRDDRVKILDFGLAKLVESAGEKKPQTDVPTRKVHTDPGTVMGTMGYMSPEQVRSQPVDHRSDIFSFGAVLYEMLTGQRAFRGDSHVETLNAILKDDPPEFSATNRALPAAFERVVWHCIEKNPERRFQSANDVAFALENLSGISSPSSAATETISFRQPSKNRERHIWIGVAAVLSLAALSLVWLYLRKSPAELRVQRLSILPPEKTFLMAGQAPLISPDGKILAFVAMDTSGKSLLYVRPLDSLVSQPLAGTDGAILPFWSPDNRALGFFAGGKLKKIELSGGQPTTLANAPNARGGAWSREGVIIFCPTPPAPLYRIPASGGEVTPINTADMKQGAFGPRWLPTFLPDGRHYLYVSSIRTVQRELRVGSLDSNDSKLLFSVYSNAVYAPAGYLIFRREATLMAQRFDVDKLAVVGDPFPIAEDVGFDATSYQGFFSVSDNGVLVYHNGAAGKTQFTWIDRTGKEIGIVGEPADQGDLQLSPDGARLAFRQVEFRTGAINIWLMDLARGAPSRFTFEQTTDFAPVWSPDGNRIVFASLRDGPPNLLQKVSNSAGNEEILIKSFIPKLPYDWSRDGRFIIYGVIDPKTSWDLWVLPLDGDRTPVPFLQTDSDERQAQFSPNGKWVAYTSIESGRMEVYVRPFPAAAGKWQISTSGGEQARWRGDGKELFYLSADHKLMAVEVNIEAPTFEHHAPNALFITRVGGIDTPGDYYAVTADGQRFLLNNLIEEAAHTPITVVLNWTGDVKH
jgi:serine/threonine protein kinase/dipeptidyl aminopeptidase/acylaminoacyl peptidase